MAKRTVPGLQLVAFWPLGDDTYKDELDDDLFALSILSQLVADDFVDGEPAGVQGKVVLTDGSDQIGIYDAGAWHYITAQEGWRAWVKSENALYVFDGVDSWDVVTAGGGGSGLPDGGAPGEVLVKTGGGDGDAGWGALTGAPGKNPEFRFNAGMLQYRLVGGDPDWIDLVDSSELPTGGVPAGGTTGQVLTKASDTDNDVEWTNGPRSPVVNSASTAYNLPASAEGQYLRFTDATAKAVTVRPNATEAMPDDGQWNIRNVGAADLTIVEGAGVTVNVPAGGTLVVPQGGTVTIKKVDTDEYDLLGQTVPA